MSEKKNVYPALFEPEENGGYSVSFPDLDGCFTQGATYEEAYANAADALSLHLYGMEEDGEAIPEATAPVPCAGALNVMVTAKEWKAKELKTGTDDPFYSAGNTAHLLRVTGEIDCGMSKPEEHAMIED